MLSLARLNYKIKLELLSDHLLFVSVFSSSQDRLVQNLARQICSSSVVKSRNGDRRATLSQP